MKNSQTKILKKLLLFICYLFLTSNIFSQNISNLDLLTEKKDTNSFKWYGNGTPFELSYQVDIPLILSCAGLNIPTFIYNSFFDSANILYDGTPFNPSEINSFDRLFMNPYNKKVDTCADVLSLGITVIPAVFVLAPKEDWLTIGIMYAETYALTTGVKELCKHSIERVRPYMYFENPPQAEIDKKDWYLSFPSGHTAYAFATAAFSTYLANEYYSDSNWKWVIIGGTYTFAFINGALRIFGGSHFPTDVLAGAAIGSFFGYFVPWLHTLTSKTNIPITFTPLGFNVNIKF